MTFRPQLTDGSVDAANSYVTVEQVRAYWLDRGVDLTQHNDASVAVAAVIATDYLDARFRWVGVPRRSGQGTQWPRRGIYSLSLQGVPAPLVAAASQLARRVLLGTVLMPDPVYVSPGQQVVETTKKVGPLETTTKYAAPSYGRPDMAGPSFPEVVLTLRGAGMLASALGGDVARG